MAGYAVAAQTRTEVAFARARTCIQSSAAFYDELATRYGLRGE
jgi:hypothetical protein